MPQPTEEKVSVAVKIKNLLRNLVIISFILIVVYFVIRSNQQLKSEVFSNPRLAFLKDLRMPSSIPSLSQFGKSKEKPSVKSGKPGVKSVRKMAPARPIDPEKSITLYLKNGSKITGELVRESNGSYVVSWEGVEVPFSPQEIARVEKTKTAQAGIELNFKNKNPQANPSA